MIRRRETYQPLARTDQPRWLVCRTMHRSVVQVRRLDPGTNLVRVFVAAILELLDSGWAVGEFSSTSAEVRYSRGAERYMLALEHVDPATHSAPAASPSWARERADD